MDLALVKVEQICYVKGYDKNPPFSPVEANRKRRPW